jgi:hypothetical protein
MLSLLDSEEAFSCPGEAPETDAGAGECDID